MALTAGQRIAMIRESATLLDKEDWGEIDLVLGQHQLSTSDQWSSDASKRSYVIEMIQHGADDRLASLHAYLTSQSDQPLIPGQSPFKSDRLRLFLSHLTTERDLIGEVGRVLGLYGIDAFVAHDAIEPSQEWQQVIEAGLTDCDALVAFVHKGFLESKWCDQEVGWVMGRKRPMLILSFDAMPHGFMAKFQAKACANLRPEQIPVVILEWLVEQKTLHTRLASSLTEAFVNSRSWNFTRATARLMEKISAFSDDQLASLEAAAQQNVDIKDCNIFGVSGPEWVAQFVAERRTSTEILWDPATPF